MGNETFKVLNKRISVLIGLVVVFMGLVCFGSNAFAGTGLTIQPIKISHTLNPGEEVKGVISLSNASDDEEVEVQTIVEDFIPAAGSSNVQFVGRSEGLSTVRDWITLDIPPSFTFKQGEAKEVSYTIKAPANAEPGGHFGVMFFKALRKSDSGQLKIGTQVGILLFVTIPGNHLQKGKILDFHVAPFVNGDALIPFNIKFENTGTVHFEPKGTIVITNMFGRKVADVPVEGQVVLPSGVRDIPVGWHVVGFLFGRYKASLTIVDPNGEVLTGGTVVFYTAPVWYVINFIASVIVLWLVLRFLKKKVKITFNP
jgi:hypothetical protein